MCLHACPCTNFLPVTQAWGKSPGAALCYRQIRVGVTSPLQLPSNPAPYIRVILSRDAEGVWRGSRNQPEWQQGQAGSRQVVTV